MEENININELKKILSAFSNNIPNEERVSIEKLINVIKKNLKLIIGISFCSMFLAMILSVLFITPIYKSTSEIIINNAADERILQTDIQASLNLINTYRDILTRAIILDEVSNSLENSLSINELQQLITVSQATNSQLLSINVFHYDKYFAQTVANLIVETFANNISDIMGIENNVSVLTPAQIPINPVSPNILQNTVIGFVLGITLATLYVIVFDYFDKTFKNEQDIKDIANISVLGSIPFTTEADFANNKHGKPAINKKMEKNDILRNKLIVRDNKTSPIAEQYRVVRTSIEFSMIAKKLKIIIITSTKPGEGKSTAICNIAATFALQGKKVLIIDADLRKPTIHQRFGIIRKHHAGLTNVLAGKLSIHEAIEKTDIDNLWVLQAGVLPHNPAELLGSEQMKDCLEKIETDYDLIFIDTPPLLPVADASILSLLCDGVILIVESGNTSHLNLLKVKESLEKTNSTIIGAILTNVPTLEKEYYYYGTDEMMKNV